MTARTRRAYSAERKVRDHRYIAHVPIRLYPAIPERLAISTRHDPNRQVQLVVRMIAPLFGFQMAVEANCEI